jgi:hypothetical protein
MGSSRRWAMTERMHDLEVEYFGGDYVKVKHFVRTKRFDDAAKPLLTGWGYQVKRELLAATKKRLTGTWNHKSKLMKEAGYTADDVTEEVIGDVEDWLRELHKAGKIKKATDG